MLDFLHEQQDDNLTDVKSKDTGKKSALVADNQTNQDEFLTVKTEGRKLQKSTILLVVLIAAGLLGLLFMIKKGTPKTIEASVIDTEQEKVDILIARLGGVRTQVSNRIDKIIKKFYEFSNTTQVPVSQLIKNPFKFDTSWQGWGWEEEDLNSIIRDYNVGNMQLISIMKSGKEKAKWCCLINDKILYEGDSIKGLVVSEIKQNYVKLKSDENELVLKLGND